jgi:pimeloyl-ACP methyl ester carboxylesterase
MALAHPERIEALIVQDAVAHNEGLGANWKTRRAFWSDRAANESALRTNLLSLQNQGTIQPEALSIVFQYQNGQGRFTNQPSRR